MAIVRELEEEAGIVLREDFKLEEMKPLFMTKGTANKYYPYILTLTERDYHEVIAKGDGSKAEDISKSVKVDVKYIKSLNPSDLITDYMLMKIKEYLNQ
jgi:8-oxo-dGTP pyrophosphatase MutT (NUDIX family)